MGRIFSLLALACLAWGQQPAVAPRPTRQAAARQAPAGPPGFVRGQVVSTTGEPVRKAEVVLTGGGREMEPLVATTDASGAFVITDVPAGTYSVMSRRPGFARPSGRSRPPMVTVAAGQEVTGVVVKLTPHAVATGKIRDEDGDPAMDASVQMLRQIWQRGRKILMPAGSAQVNDLGEFRVAGLAPGKYLLSVVSRGGMGPRTAAKPGRLGYATVYYPGVTDASQAQAVEIGAAQEARLDLQLRRVPLFSVRGQVVDESGTPSPRGIAVSSTPDQEGAAVISPRGFARVRPDGTFELTGLAPGSYVVTARRMDSTRGQGMVKVLVGNRDVDNVALRLVPPVDAPVSVRIEGDQAGDTSTVRVRAESERAGVNEDNFPPDPRPEARNSVPLAPSGRMRLSVENTPEGTYLKSVKIGSTDVTDKYFEVAGAAAPIEVLLARGAGQVTGTVQTSESKPFPGGFAVLAPEGSKRSQYWLFRTAIADGAGAFTLKNVRPGVYTLFAFTDNLDGAWQDPDFLKQNEAKGTTLKIGENGSESAQPKVIE